MSHNPLTTVSAAGGTNGLTCLPKHGGARDNKHFGHPSNDWPTLLNLRNRTPKRSRGHRAPHLHIIVNSIWTLVVACSPSCVIHKKALCPGKGDNNRLMTCDGPISRRLVKKRQLVSSGINLCQMPVRQESTLEVIFQVAIAYKM
jgi:hypothetical protein